MNALHSSCARSPGSEFFSYMILFVPIRLTKAHLTSMVWLWSIPSFVYNSMTSLFSTSVYPLHQFTLYIRCWLRPSCGRVLSPSCPAAPIEVLLGIGPLYPHTKACPQYEPTKGIRLYSWIFFYCNCALNCHIDIKPEVIVTSPE